MRARVPSQTAMIVALLRALAQRGFTLASGFHDPIAERLLPRPWRAILDWLARWLSGMRPNVRTHVIEQFDVVARRTAAIDRALESAVAAGCDQLVNLGAGVDTRAFRMPQLAGVEVYEVDHPATQAWKRGKAASVTVVARELHYVPLDFERQALVPALVAAGHRSDRPTVWISEGVVMYLTEDALRATLSSVFELSAPGSVLIVNYHEPADGRGPLAWNASLTRWIGEPQLGLRTRESMSDEIARAGFRVLHDQRVDAQARIARLLVADRPATAAM